MTAVLYHTRPNASRPAVVEIVTDGEVGRRLYHGEVLRMFRVADRTFGIAESRIIRTRRLP